MKTEWSTPAASSNGYAINGLNQVANVNGGASFSYDLRGNLTSDASSTSYSYNINNLLTLVTTSGSSVTKTLGYDPSNRLLSITNDTTTTKFLYDGSDLIAEYDGAGTLLKRYVHGPGDDEPLMIWDPSGNASYLGADQVGSITSTTYGPTGAVTVNTYGEYGLQGAGNTGRFRYTGQTWLGEVGMYYYKARLYNPAIGRFLQTDPIGYGDGMNMYNYVHGDPVNGRDPSGLSCVTNSDGNTSCDFTGSNCYFGSCGSYGSSTFTPTPGGGGSGQLTSGSSSGPINSNWSNPGNAFANTNIPDGSYADVTVIGQRRNFDGGYLMLVGSPFVTGIPLPPNTIDPFDPKGLNKPMLSPIESSALAKYAPAIQKHQTSVTSHLNPHPYRNFPSRNTGAILPPGIYTTYYLPLGNSVAGDTRIVQDSVTGKMYYTNNHYDSFYPLN